MDPISALGVAAAAVQFVDFSGTAIRGIIDVYRFLETKDLPQYFQQMKTSARRLQGLNLRLRRSLGEQQLGRTPTDTENQMIALANRCVEVAEEIIQALDDIHPEMSKSKMEAMRNALKAVWQRDMLESLKQQMFELRDQLMFVVLLNLRDEIGTSARNLVSLGNASSSIWKGSPNVGAEILEKLEKVQNGQDNLKKALKDVQSSEADVGDESASGGRERGPIDMTAWVRTPVANSLINGLLSSLEFRAITERETRIEDAHTHTFEWIFNNAEQSGTALSSMADWLHSGTGLYWITGKAGSGKSTLLKFLVHHSQTKRLLKSWAGKKDPVIASFYFWHAGSEMQTSQEGLLRTLLFQAISQYRHIAPEKFPGRWESLALASDHSRSWSWDELEQAFRFLLEEQDPDIKFCFFIDGLDEFKGDLTALISLIHRISLCPNAKICVSSRPWIVFEDAFRARPQLMLQDLTKSDVLQYVRDKLSAHSGFLELRSMDEGYADSLVENVAEKASGVFLWVVVVVRSLLEGLGDGDRLSDLQKRLDALPPELDDLFKRILHNFNPLYFNHASALFQIFRASEGRPSLICLSFADEEDPEFAIRAEVKPITADQKLYRALAMRRRLDSRCKGLLEIAPIQIRRELAEVSYLRDVSKITTRHADLIAETKVEYLHRTVKDFLQRPGTWEEITAATDSSFNANTALARAFLMQLKWIRSEPGNAAEGAWDDILWMLKYAARSEQQEGFQFKLLDELDEAASRIFTETCDSLGQTLISRHGDGLYKPIHWSAARAPFSANNTFLTLTVQCGLTLYLQEKLSRECLDAPTISNLLHVAVENFNIGYLGPHGPDFRRTKPNMDIVGALLAHSNLPPGARARWLAQALNTEAPASALKSTPPSSNKSTRLIRRGSVKGRRSLEVSDQPSRPPRQIEPERRVFIPPKPFVEEPLPHAEIKTSSSVTANNPSTPKSLKTTEVITSKRRSIMQWPFRHKSKS